jgi:beta-galactosidase
LKLEKIKTEGDIITLQVKILDDQDVPCLESVNWIRFGITGEGELLDNLGTSTSARYVQAYNGRALIRVKKRNGKSVVSVTSKDLPVAFVNID